MNVYRPEERRLVLRLMAYWDDLRGDRSYPTMTEVDPAAIGNDWPFCCLLALRTPLSHSTFEYLGDALLGADGQTRAPRKLGDTAEHALVYHALGYLDRMLEKGVPVSLGNEAQLDEGPALYRSILLPLSEDGRRIDHVLAAANYRWVAVADSAGEALSDAGGAPA